MVYILAGPEADKGPLSTRAIAQMAESETRSGARRRGRRDPDRSERAPGERRDARRLQRRQVHPRAAERRAAPRTQGSRPAAWVHSAPHHGFSRSMKVGKEEAIGMLMAVEMWMKRDHKAEWSRWLAWLDSIATQVSTIDGVTTSIAETTELSNRTPSLTIRWDPKRLGISGAALAKHLLDTEPRIATPGGRDRGGRSQHLDHALHDGQPARRRSSPRGSTPALSNPPRAGRARAHGALPQSDVTGQWDVHIEYPRARRPIRCI